MNEWVESPPVMRKEGREGGREGEKGKTPQEEEIWCRVVSPTH